MEATAPARRDSGNGVSVKAAEKGLAAHRLAALAFCLGAWLLTVAVIAPIAVRAADPEPSPPAAEADPQEPAPAPGEVCTRFVSPDGTNSNPGTEELPYKTVQRLADELMPGETGCLRGATYYGDVEVDHPGRAGEPITITSYPGERATLAGRLAIREGADFITVISLDLDGRSESNLPSPAVNANDAVFIDNDVTNYNTTICFNLGGTVYGRADRTVIEGNRIHGCGELPAGNLDHGIYVEHATDTVIVGNLVYDNADRGIQLYPDAQNSYIADNVIDGNGEGVMIAGGEEEFGPQASNGNLIEHNVITFSTERYNVEADWGDGAPGEDNLVRRNCVYGGARASDRAGLALDAGFVAEDNLLADPLYVDRDARDLRLGVGSPCLYLDAGTPPWPAPLGDPFGAGGSVGASPVGYVTGGAPVAAAGRASRPRSRSRGPRRNLRRPTGIRHERFGATRRPLSRLRREGGVGTRHEWPRSMRHQGVPVNKRVAPGSGRGGRRHEWAAGRTCSWCEPPSRLVP
jgi:parallel beta-helix repeat protein